MTAETAPDELRRIVMHKIGPTALAGHLVPEDLGCRITHDGAALVVTLTGPPTDPRTRQALAVRVMDAIRSAGRVYGRVVVSYEAPSRGDGSITLSPSGGRSG